MLSRKIGRNNWKRATRIRERRTPDMEFQFSLGGIYRISWISNWGLAESSLPALSIQLHSLQVIQEKRFHMCSRARAHRPYNFRLSSLHYAIENHSRYLSFFTALSNIMSLPDKPLLFDIELNFNSRETREEILSASNATRKISTGEIKISCNRISK